MPLTTKVLDSDFDIVRASLHQSVGKLNETNIDTARGNQITLTPAGIAIVLKADVLPDGTAREVTLVPMNAVKGIVFRRKAVVNV